MLFWVKHRDEYFFAAAKFRQPFGTVALLRGEDQEPQRTGRDPRPIGSRSQANPGSDVAARHFLTILPAALLVFLTALARAGVVAPHFWTGANRLRF